MSDESTTPLGATTGSGTDAVIRLEAVTRSYGEPAVRALRGVDLEVTRGSLVALVGPSGSGKSSLLNIIGTLDRPTSGRVEVAGIDVAALRDAELSALRAHHIGFVFQHFHLADGTDAVDNVADGLLYRGVPRARRRDRARDMLHRVGLGHRLAHLPHQLSGGERQRVAVARALVGDPTLVLCDEPTGNLDSEAGASVVQLLRDVNDAGTTVVVITHDEALARDLPRRVSIRDGLVVSDDERLAQ